MGTTYELTQGGYYSLLRHIKFKLKENYMKNLRYKKLVQDFHESEEGVIQWIVVSGKPVRRKYKGYLERNLGKTLRHIFSRKNFGKKI